MRKDKFTHNNGKLFVKLNKESSEFKYHISIIALINYNGMLKFKKMVNSVSLLFSYFSFLFNHLENVIKHSIYQTF